MDIGNQQRVIIVELDKTATTEQPQPDVEEFDPAAELELESAVEWPLPLEIEAVS